MTVNSPVPPPMSSCHTGNGAVDRADCASKVLVILEHQDTLGRPLPEGIRVKVRDSRLKSYMGVTATATYLPPPILIDLHTPPGSGGDRLSDDQIEQLRRKRHAVRRRL